MYLALVEEKHGCPFQQLCDKTCDHVSRLRVYRSRPTVMKFFNTNAWWSINVFAVSKRYPDQRRHLEEHVVPSYGLEEVLRVYKHRLWHQTLIMGNLIDMIPFPDRQVHRKMKCCHRYTSFEHAVDSDWSAKQFMMDREDTREEDLELYQAVREDYEEILSMFFVAVANE